MRDWPQFEDLQLVDDDHTEDMRKAPVAPEALPKNTHHPVTREEVQ